MDTSHLKFSRDLLTPRKDIAERSGVSRSELTSSQRLRRIEGVYLSSDRTFADRTEAVDEVGQLVRHTLSFGSLAMTGKLWSKDEEKGLMTTNCFGHTIVASELMEELEIPHTVSFANGHSFITLFDTETDQAHMVDPPSKDLFLDIDGLVYGESPLVQLAKAPTKSGYSVATNILDSQGIMQRIRRKPSSQLIGEYPWLSMQGHFSGSRIGRRQGLADTQLIMRTYYPASGREALAHYGMAGQHILEKDFEQAAAELTGLFGVYPEIDARNKLEPATALRHELGKIGSFGAMQDLAAVVDSSLWYGERTEDRTTNRYFLLDTLRAIGTRLEDPEVVAIARDGYNDLRLEIPAARHKVRRANEIMKALE